MFKAVTLAPGRIEIRQTPEPVPAPGQAVVRVETVGLCGGDFSTFTGHHPYVRYPQTQGHEFVGIVDSLPSDYAGAAVVGSRVAVEPLVACGICFACRRGRYNCCSQLQVMGAHIPGALAELVAVPATSLYPVDGLDAVTAVLVEPMSIGLQAVTRSGAAAGDAVVVLGAGPIGQAVTLGCADRGARVLVADRIPERLKLAEMLGAQRIVDTSRADLAAEVEGWTGGDGAAVVIEATGVPALIRAAVDLVAHSGTVVVVGISDQMVELPVIDFTRKEVSIRGSRNNAGLFGEAVELVRRNATRVRPLVTHEFPLAAVAEAITFALEHPDEAEKVVIRVGGTA